MFRLAVWGLALLGKIDLAQQAKPFVRNGLPLTSQAYHHNAQQLLHHHLHRNPQKVLFLMV
jgi:hypothetical protein